MAVVAGMSVAADDDAEPPAVDPVAIDTIGPLVVAVSDPPHAKASRLVRIMIVLRRTGASIDAFMFRLNAIRLSFPGDSKLSATVQVRTRSKSRSGNRCAAPVDGDNLRP